MYITVQKWCNLCVKTAPDLCITTQQVDLCCTTQKVDLCFTHSKIADVATVDVIFIRKLAFISAATNARSVKQTDNISHNPPTLQRDQTQSINLAVSANNKRYPFYVAFIPMLLQ